MTVVTQSLAESLGAMPSGATVRVNDDVISKHLRENYLDSNTEAARRAEMRKRLDLFKDRGRPYFEAVIDDVFTNEQVRRWRKVFVKYAEFQNVTKRVIREVSAVYSEPAKRVVGSAQKRYVELQRVTRMDRRMRRVNHMGNLLNNVLVWPDVIMGRPVLRVITPDKFWAIHHPSDPGMLVGVIIEQFNRGVVKPKVTDPHYLVIDGVDFFNLDKDGRFVKDSRRPHGVGRMPALLFSRDECDESLLDWHSGSDLTSAHLAVALLNTMMLKHQKSGTKQAYAQGDMSTTPLDQPMDEQHMLQVGEGISLNTLDLGADPGSYIDATRAVIKQIAANYGIPESVFDLSYQSTSGFEIELKRTGLREIRRDQILDFRPFERELADVQSAVLQAAPGMEDFRFNTASWSIDFGEVETPRDPKAMLEYFEKLEDLELTNRPEMYQELNPEATMEEAEAAVAINRAMRVARMQDFQSRNPGAFGPSEAGGNAPTDREGNRLTVIDGGDEEDREQEA